MAWLTARFEADFATVQGLDGHFQVRRAGSKGANIGVGDVHSAIANFGAGEEPRGLLRYSEDIAEASDPELRPAGRRS
jgi:hypothetical protein